MSDDLTKNLIELSFGRWEMRSEGARFSSSAGRNQKVIFSDNTSSKENKKKKGCLWREAGKIQHRDFFFIVSLFYLAFKPVIKLLC
jgi:hypothetical protein